MSNLNSEDIKEILEVIYKYSKMPDMEFWPNGTPYRPGKTNTTFVARALGHMVWKHMNPSCTTNVSGKDFGHEQPEKNSHLMYILIH